MEGTNEIIQQTSFLQDLAIFMDEGGIFMYIIAGVWIIGVAIALERVKSFFTYDIDSDNLMSIIKRNILLNDVQKAIQACSNTKALLPIVLRDGLKRANQPKEHIMDSLEAAVLDAVPKLEKRMNYLGLIANISTLVGLLGTIYGLIQSFSAVATADPASKAKLLALGISKAMNTTALGLISAISILVIHSILTSKSDKIIADIEKYSLRLVDILGTKKSTGGHVPPSPAGDDTPPAPKKGEDSGLPPAPDSAA